MFLLYMKAVRIELFLILLLKWQYSHENNLDQVVNKIQTKKKITEITKHNHS